MNERIFVGDGGVEDYSLVSSASKDMEEISLLKKSRKKKCGAKISIEEAVLRMSHRLGPSLQ